MSENYYALVRLSARKQFEQSAEARRDHVGAAVAHATNDRQARSRRMASMIDGSLVVIQRALKRPTTSANALTYGGETETAAH